MTDMISLAERAVELARKAGGEISDVVATDTRIASSEVEKGSIKQASSVIDPGVAIRVFHKGSSGFAYCSGHEDGDIRRAVDLAVAQARAGTPDADFKNLPMPSAPASPSGLYDQAVADMRPEEAVDQLLALVNEATSDSRITSVNAGVTVSVCEVALANSNGVSASQRMTSYDVMAEAVAREGPVMFSGMDYSSGRRVDRDAPRSVGESAKEHALRGLRQTRIPTGDYPVILDPLAVGFVFGEAIGDGANAENVQRNRSYLSGRLEAEIGSEMLTIHDDPTLDWALGSTAFDGEGVVARRKPIVERGVLMSYLHDSYTAAKDSVESTGNSSRGGAVWGYRHPPGISFSNLVVRQGDATSDEMIRDCGRGVYLRITFDTPNLATGEFSGLMMEGYSIERGELGPVIQQSTIGINLLDLFSRIDLVGSRSRTAFGVSTPHLRVSSARIGGSG